MKDKLYETALFYEKQLNNKEFHLKAGRKGELIEFDIIFRDEHFKHLIGFHKLVNLPEHRDSSSIILESILNHRMDYNYISSSAYHSEIKNRIDNFEELKNCLFSNELMLGRINENSFKRIQADFLMTKDMDLGIAHLFLKKNGTALTIPVTFFTAEKNEYLINSSKWTILEMYEILKTKKVKKNSRRRKVATY